MLKTMALETLGSLSLTFLETKIIVLEFPKLWSDGGEISKDLVSCENSTKNLQISGLLLAFHSELYRESYHADNGSSNLYFYKFSKQSLSVHGDNDLSNWLK